MNGRWLQRSLAAQVEWSSAASIFAVFAGLVRLLLLRPEEGLRQRHERLQEQRVGVGRHVGLVAGENGDLRRHEDALVVMVSRGGEHLDHVACFAALTHLHHHEGHAPRLHHVGEALRGRRSMVVLSGQVVVVDDANACLSEAAAAAKSSGCRERPAEPSNSSENSQQRGALKVNMGHRKTARRATPFS